MLNLLHSSKPERFLDPIAYMALLMLHGGVSVERAESAFCSVFSKDPHNECEALNPALFADHA